LLEFVPKGQQLPARIDRRLGNLAREGLVVQFPQPGYGGQ
jgi:hypothetical protein